MSVATVCEPDTAAPHVGAVFQKRIIVQPMGGPRGKLLAVSIHGTNGDSGSIWANAPSNNPAYPNDRTSYSRILTEAIGNTTPVVSHDMSGINPVTGVMDVNQFGSKAVMDLIETMRTTLAPQLGCRSDKIILYGGSQGYNDVVLYMLQYPTRVACAVGFGPGADIELDRLGTWMTTINQNWGLSSPYHQVLSLALGVGGPALRIGGPGGITSPYWTSGRSYAQYDVVWPDANSTTTTRSFWMCNSAHTASGSTMPVTGGLWTPVDPLSIHFTVPSEGGTSLAFQSGSPLAGQPASVLEPANITRMANIISGRQTGTPVPLHIYYSAGDVLAMSQGTNGVMSGIVPWYGAKVGATLVKISDTFNHGLGYGAQPMDPAFATSGSMSSTGSFQVKAGGNAEVVFRLQGTWSGTVVFETTSNAAGTSGWVSHVAQSTVPVLSNPQPVITGDPAGLGPNITSTTTNGYYRMATTGYVWARVRRTSGTGTCSVTGGPVNTPDAQVGAVPVEDVVRKMMAAA